MTEELKEQIHERVYNIKVPTLGFSRRDLFNIAMEYAEPREKRIAELEKENKTVSRKANEAIADKLLITAKYNEVLNDLNQQNDTLQKENAELDCQKNRNKFCYSCANATERCFRNEIGCPCGKYKSYKDENAELKADNSEWEKASDKWKSVYELTNNQLSNAKELINELNEGLDKLYLSGLSQKQIAYVEKLQDKAEKFISEVGK